MPERPKPPTVATGYFDFGVSTEDQGLTLNDSLYRFKASFGAGGTVYEEFEIDLSAFQ